MIKEFNLKELNLKGIKLIPEGYPLMFEAWIGCVLWAIGEEEIRKVFKKKTGFDLSGLENRSVIVEMIDKSSGFENDILAAFCDFVTENIWGVAQK